ncbi:hypothetical protein RYX36_010267 [Vicia faba]
MVFKKSGSSPKNGEQYGAPFKEEEWADDDVVDFNVNSAEWEAPNAVMDPHIDQLQSLLDDEINEIIKAMFDVEPVLEQDYVNGYTDFPQVVNEETRSMVTGQFSETMIFPDPGGNFQSSSQHYDAQPNFDFNQSVTSHFHISKAPEVTSASNIQSKEKPVFYEDDFLEINDLFDTESIVSNSKKKKHN